VLLEHPQRVDLSVLGTFAEYREFRAIRHEKQEDAGSLAVSTDVSPSEAIGTLVEDSNAALAADLLERVLAQPPVFLEALALRLLAAMGYGAESLFSNTPASRGTQVLTA
jgi:restriction system protein